MVQYSALTYFTFLQLHREVEVPLRSPPSSAKHWFRKDRTSRLCSAHRGQQQPGHSGSQADGVAIPSRLQLQRQTGRIGESLKRQTSLPPVCHWSEQIMWPHPLHVIGQSKSCDHILCRSLVKASHVAMADFKGSQDPVLTGALRQGKQCLSAALRIATKREWF